MINTEKLIKTIVNASESGAKKISLDLVIFKADIHEYANFCKLLQSCSIETIKESSPFVTVCITKIF